MPDFVKARILFAAILLPCAVAWAAAAPVAKTDVASAAAPRVGRLLRLSLPITAESERLVRRFVARATEESQKNRTRPVLILQFDVPAGQENYGRGSQFGASLELAKFLASDALAGATTVAWLPRSIQGHAVLVAAACDEFLMAPDATIGAAGIDSQPIDDAMRAAYRDIAGRRRTVPVELALRMLDPAHHVLEVETEVSREFVTPQQLAELRRNHTIKSEKPVLPPGEPGQFTGAEARRLGFVSSLAGNLRDVARALQLRAEQIEESILSADHWKTVRVDLGGPVSAEKAQRIQRLIEDAVQRDSVDFVCLSIDSAGGSPADSANLANFLAGLPSGKVRTVAYVPEMARGDAAMVALACDQIVMGPDAVLGGAGDDVMSADEIRQAVVGIKERAAQKSRSWSLPAAMVDPNLTVYQYTYSQEDAALTEYFSEDELKEQPDREKWTRGQAVTTPRRLFQADGQRAVEFHLANHTATDFAAFKEIYGLTDDPALAEPSWADSLVRVLASPMVAMILLMVGGAAIYAELHTPGVGLGGFLAIVCFVLFFWAQLIGENAVWLEVLLFLAGLGCLALEIFVLPGFGIFGIGGAVLVLASLVLATQTFFLPRNEYQLHQFTVSLSVVAGAGLGVVVLAGLLNRWLPHAPLLNRVMLAPPTREEKEFIRQSESLVHFEELLGQEGVTTTPLTPNGKARFGDRLVDVMADGEFLAPGTRVAVVEIHGNRVTVEPIEEK